MKYIIFAIIIALAGCNAEKNLLDSWVGKSKQELIQAWGPPIRTASDGGSGEILIYSSSYFNGYNGITSYHIRMMYIDRHDNIYHWRWQNSQQPPSVILLR